MNHQQPRGLPPPPLGAMGRGAPGGPPPPPPPPPGIRSGTPGSQGPPPGHPAHQGGRGGPPPQMQMPMRPRHESSHVVDLNATDKRPLDEAACKELLTTYRVYSIRKVTPDGKEKPTWAKAVVTEEALSQEDVAAQLETLKRFPQTIADKKGALFPNQQGQVNRLLDQLKTEELDPHFDWSLVQLGRRERSSNKVRATVLITVIVKRAVMDQFNALALYHFFEKNKQERLAAELTRPPMPPQPQPPPTLNDQPPAVVGVLRTPGQTGGNRGRSRSRSRQRPARYHSDSNSDSESDNDTASTGASTTSSSLVTSISSRSDERSRRYHSRTRRGRSHSKHRPREHQKKYFNGRSESPEPIYQELRRSSHPNIPYTGEVASIAAPDAIAQAFLQGREEERAVAQHYLSQLQRPIISDEPTRAIIPAGRRELEYNSASPRYPSHQYAEVPMVEAPRYVKPQYSRPVPRYRDPLYNDRHLDDLYEDDAPPVVIRNVRPVPREAVYRRHLSDAESYIARDPIAPRIPFTGLRPQIPQVRHHYPTTPRSPPRYRYASSYSSDSAYT
ncbi:hypothetical protein SBOR_0426 [Sclerotinia borealis F-4128]|uniref:Uncharacterized protein n=1 Tax=Sclerotinia borealis (strain F-4128) TaxID=1432307 RepID=W9CX43_SCLBF|nr:hypothetical protein SBOR_0426 [Sclerotinia borealis F-4128]